MRSGCRPQSELAPLLKDLLRVTPSRLVVVAIVARVQPRASEGHADLASSSPSSPVRGQSRLILITGNEGCVRYPTEGNDSCHELTTVSSPLLLMARTILSSVRFAHGRRSTQNIRRFTRNKTRMELAFYESVSPA